MAKQMGINRVVLAVWDLEDGMAFYSKLLSSAFTETTTDLGRSFGVRVAMNFDAGVELVAPLPGAETSSVRDFLEENGEGVSGVVFAVPDADEARDAAASLGWTPNFKVDFGPDRLENELGGRFSTFKEYFYTGKAPLPVTVLLGEFDTTEPEAS